MILSMHSQKAERFSYNDMLYKNNITNIRYAYFYECTLFFLHKNEFI